MKIGKHGIEVEIQEGMVRAEEDYGVLSADRAAEMISKLYCRQVEALYIMEDDNCAPVLLIRWNFHLDGEDGYHLLPVTCSEQEMALLRRMGIL